MAAFEDFISNFRNAYSPENFNLDEFTAAATEAYSADKGVWDAAVTEKDGTLQSAQADLQKARAANWKLLTGKGGALDPKTAQMTGPKPEGEGDDTAPTIDSFFGTPTKKE